MKRIISIAFAIVMLVSAGFQADAQVNLNALKNAAKNKAASAIQNAARNAAAKKSEPAQTQPAATTQTQTTTQQPVQEPVQNTAAATAAEPAVTPAPAPAPAATPAPEPKKENDNLFPVHNVPCPWPMEKDDDDYNNGPVAQYIKKLGYIENSAEVIALRDALMARFYEDSLEVARLKPLRLQMEMKHDMAFDELEKEIKRYDHFLSMLGDMTVRFNFQGTLDINTGNSKIDRIQVPVNNTSIYVMWDKNDGLEYFYDISGNKCFVEDEDMKIVDSEIRRYLYICNFLEKAMFSDREFYKVAFQSSICNDVISKARKRNSVDNIEFQPYPKGGALNSLAAKALASAKQNESYADAIAVVIDAPSWTVDYDAFGQPIRRKAGGWVIKNTKYGKKAYRAQFSEDYLGGGKYGEIKLYGIGGGQCFVK